MRRCKTCNPGVVLVLALLLGFLNSGAWAHSKTDTVTLYNGDRITGEITGLQSARLTVKTDAMGTLSIEWKDVASINSRYRYELRVASGERLYGTVSPGPAPGLVLLRDDTGSQALHWDEVAELRPIEATIEDRLDIYLSANYSFTKASGVSQTELRANVAYEDEASLNSFTSRTTLSDTDTETTNSARHSLSRRVWTDRESLYRTVFGGYENNDELGLDYRYTLGGGFGRYFSDNPTSNLIGSVSIQGLRERVDGGEKSDSVEAVLSLGYRRWRFDTPQLDLLIEGSLYPSLSESGRVRADSNARLRWELVEDLYWDISAWYIYDNAADSADASEFDWGLTTGIGWDF